jgi:putative FmdB family regulatory protein
MVRTPWWYLTDMPTYEFRCAQCGHAFEVTARIADRDEKAVCPECGSRKVATVFRAFAVGKGGAGADLLSRVGSASLGAPKP